LFQSGFSDLCLSVTMYSTIFLDYADKRGKGAERCLEHIWMTMKITDALNQMGSYKDSTLLTVGAFLSS